ICATLNPGATATDISNAINTCPDGQVVFLTAGTYNLSTSIDFHKGYVTLRGAGPDQTFFVFSDGSGCNRLQGKVCLPQNNFNSATSLHVVNWTGGYTQGTTQITLACGGDCTQSPYILTTNSNQLIFLDQLDDQTQAPTLPPDGIFVSSDCSWQVFTCTAF